MKVANDSCDGRNMGNCIYHLGRLMEVRPMTRDSGLLSENPVLD